MWYFTEIANWFETKRRSTNAELDKWVEHSNNNQGAMIIASTTKAFATFGAGFADLLRLGDGVKEGNLKGVGTDAMRFVAIFPWGKAVQTIKGVQGVHRAKLVHDPRGPICFWVTSTKALAHTGYKFNGRLFASVDDLAQAANVPLHNLGSITLTAGRTHLINLGARVGPIRNITTLQDITRMIRSDGSVVLVSLRAMNGNNNVGGHIIYAYRNALGQVRFMDRTVGRTMRNGKIQDIFTSIEQIVPLYRAHNVTHFAIQKAVILENVFVKVVAEVPILVIPILGVIAEDRP